MKEDLAQILPQQLDQRLLQNLAVCVLVVANLKRALEYRFDSVATISPFRPILLCLPTWIWRLFIAPFVFLRLPFF